MVDDSLLNEFFIDTQSHLEGIEEDALGLEKDHSSKELIDDIFRRVHSIKGNAGMLGYGLIHESGQVFETFLDGVRDRGTTTNEEVERIFNFFDQLKSVVGQLREEKGFGSEQTLLAEELIEPIAEDSEPETDYQDMEPPMSVFADPDPLVTPDLVNVAFKDGIAKTEETEEGTIAAPIDQPITFLIFELAGESYAIDLVKIREIISLENITRVPNTKHFVEGVMNLRDQIIPVFNLKRKLEVATDNDDECVEKNIVIVEIDKVATGLKVDEVTGIKAIAPSMITSPDSFYGNIPTNYLVGVGQAEEGAIIILNADDLCDPTEILF